jgi:hypothetical protein
MLPTLREMYKEQSQIHEITLHRKKTIYMYIHNNFTVLPSKVPVRLEPDLNPAAKDCDTMNP